MAHKSVSAPITRTEMESIRDKASKDSLSPVELDRMSAQLPRYDEVRKEDIGLLFDTYEAVCEGYSRIKHQRQAYLLYKQYLSQKEAKLYLDLKDTVLKAREAFSNRAANLDDEMKSTQDGAESMITSSENYGFLHSYYQRFTALAIVILTVLFAISLVRSRVKLNNMKREIQSVREHAADLHKPSTIGRIQAGIRNGQAIAIDDQLKSLSQHKESLLPLSSQEGNKQLEKAIESLSKTRSFFSK
ncbi:MAG: hypothetical protein ACKOA1_04190, partial [Bacteroidota bacterium]